jgi:RNA polymerase sigma-70 factor, ECF subfamily
MPEPDQHAFMRQWTQAQPHLAAYIGAMVRDRHAAEDLLQEVAVILWRKFGDYDAAKPFIAWGIGIARLEVLESKRSAGRSILAYHSDLLDTVEAEFVAGAVECEDRADALRQCVKGVSERTWRLLRLRYEEALKPQAIAARLGADVNAVRVALHRARGALEQCIERRLAPGRRP